MTDSDYSGPSWMEVRDAYAEGSRSREEEFDLYEKRVAEEWLIRIAEQLRGKVYESTPGPAISWNAVLEALGFDTPEKRVEFTEQYADQQKEISE